MSNITFEELRQYSKQLFDQERENLYGADGQPGESAYDTAVENGFTGTRQEWLDSLQGADGKSAYDLAVENGFTGTEQEFKDQLTTPPKGAYELAVDNGFVGTEQEWLDSLKGRSAYEAAVDNGFVGTEQEWLDQLSSSSGGGTAIGGVVYSTNQPTGFLPCDGAKYLQSSYPNLFSSVGLLKDGFKDSTYTTGYPVEAGLYFYQFNPVFDYLYGAKDNHFYGGLYVYDSTNFTELFAFDSNSNRPAIDDVRDIKVSKDGTLLACALDSPMYYTVIDVVNNHTIFSGLPSFPSSSSRAFFTTISPDSRYVAFGGYDDQFIQILDMNTLTFITLPDPPTAYSRGMKFLNNSNKLVFCDATDGLQIIDCDNSFTRTITGITGEFTGTTVDKFDVSPDDRYVIAGSTSAPFLTMYDLVDSVEVTDETIKPPADRSVTDIKFSPDGKFIHMSFASPFTDSVFNRNAGKYTENVITQSIIKYHYSADGSMVYGHTSNDSDPLAIISAYDYDPDTEFVTPIIKGVSDDETVKAYIKGDDQ